MMSNSAPDPFSNIRSELVNAGNPFRVLLEYFHRGHEEHGEPFLGLELLTEKELDVRIADDRSDVIAPAGLLQFNDPRSGSPFHVAAVQCGLEAGGKYHQINIDNATKSWEFYEPLAKFAGARVPTKIREAMPVDPYRDLDVWFSLIYWQSNPSVALLNVYPESRRILAVGDSGSVFKDSIQLIEDCLLGAGESVLPGTLNLPAVEEPDGPCGLYQWRHNGKTTTSAMPPAPWKMAKHLWGLVDRSATFSELILPIYDDQDHVADENAFSSHRKKANNFFNKNNIPWKVALKGGTVALLSRE